MLSEADVLRQLLGIYIWYPVPMVLFLPYCLPPRTWLVRASLLSSIPRHYHWYCTGMWLYRARHLDTICSEDEEIWISFTRRTSSPDDRWRHSFACRLFLVCLDQQQRDYMGTSSSRRHSYWRWRIYNIYPGSQLHYRRLPNACKQRLSRKRPYPVYFWSCIPTICECSVSGPRYPLGN